MNKTTKTVLVIIALGIIAFLFFKLSNTAHSPDQAFQTEANMTARNTFVFTTTDGQMGRIEYLKDNPEQATLVMGGASYDLHQSVSASGAKYTNDDESVMYWEHQGEAMIDIDGTETTATDITPADILVFDIAPYKQDCDGVGKRQCLVVNGKLFYDTIADFDFKEGTSSTITVARTKRENAPADASAYQYRRIVVLKSNKQGDPDANRYDNADQGCNEQDDNCDGVESPQGSNDGATIVIEAGAKAAANGNLDDDDDGDSIPIEDDDEASVNAGTQTKASTATDYNSSRSNKSTSY